MGQNFRSKASTISLQVRRGHERSERNRFAYKEVSTVYAQIAAKRSSTAKYLHLDCQNLSTAEPLYSGGRSLDYWFATFGVTLIYT